MELKRKIYSSLLEWKKTNLSLFLLGARQVGKSHIINAFIKNEFRNNYASITLYNNVDLIQTIIKSKDDDDFLLRISLYTKEMIKETTIIFIDEIQEYYSYLSKHPEIDKYYDLISAAKSFGENKKNRFIFSGSLLRIEMEHFININPEGYLYPLNMYPLDFEEFLWARGIDSKHIDIVKECFKNKVEVPDYLHKRLLNEFKYYLLIGGMPKAVSRFIDTNSFIAVEMEHRTIDTFIRNDITKYAKDEDKIKINSIYELLPRELNSPTKRFILSDIEKHKKNEQEYLNFDWLAKAGIAIQVFAVSEPKLPLKSNSSLNKLKLFHEDVGLLTYLLMDSDAKLSILNDDIDINYGAIYENAAAELLRTHGFDELYFYFKKGVGEVDFVLNYDNGVTLVEIKSGKNYTRQNAMNNLNEIENYNFNHNYVFYNDNYKKEGNKEYYPIYMIDLIKTRKFNFFN